MISDVMNLVKICIRRMQVCKFWFLKVPSYTAWWQRHVSVRNLPRVFTPWARPRLEPATSWSQVRRSIDSSMVTAKEIFISWQKDEDDSGVTVSSDRLFHVCGQSNTPGNSGNLLEIRPADLLDTVCSAVAKFDIRHHQLVTASRA